MMVALLLMVGFAIDIVPGAECEVALHRLRTEEKLRIEATNTMDRLNNEGQALVYTLTKGQKKTAILVCAFKPDDYNP